jgi:hypothetical protein
VEQSRDGKNKTDLRHALSKLLMVCLASICEHQKWFSISAIEYPFVYVFTELT